MCNCKCNNKIKKEKSVFVNDRYIGVTTGKITNPYRNRHLYTAAKIRLNKL